MLRIGANTHVRDEDEPLELRGKCSDLVVQFRACTAQCLAHADFVQPQDGLVEALVFSLFAEFAFSRDFNPSLWILQGLIVRLAVRTGYHAISTASSCTETFKVRLVPRPANAHAQADTVATLG